MSRRRERRDARRCDSRAARGLTQHNEAQVLEAFPDRVASLRQLHAVLEAADQVEFLGIQIEQVTVYVCVGEGGGAVTSG